MSDSFGRHKSTRWANASVPSYGEEWDGDDYDYDYGSNDDKSHSSEPAVDAQDPSPNSDLVLSIDQIHREEDSDLGSDSDVSLETPKLSSTSLPRGSDSDFDFHGKPSVAPIDTSRNPEKTETEKIVHGEDDIPAQHVVSTRAIDDVMVPPTPTFSTHKEPDTPRSESSFQSDADSIQYEPKDLNIRGPEKEIDVTGDAYENEHQSQSSTESAAQDSALSSSQTESEHLVSSSPVTAAHTEPLVLTIDREQSSTDSDTSTIEDVDERNTHDQRSSRDINEDDDNPLDSLIYDLQSATTNDKGHLPTLDSLQDIKLPDFENTSFGHLKEYEVESPSTPTAPLDMSRSHQEYVKAQTPRKSSVRKAPRTELMSVDYSNIADAVSGYMSDGRPESLRKESFVNPIVEDDSSPEADEEHDQSDLESRDLHPVVSSGSLSTGKLSLASSIQPSKNESKEDVSRRVSTSTINMGGWKPNTNNYRDQFINDIDNESVVNFNAQGNDGYRQFTNLRNSSGGSGFDSVAETQSNASSLSIPETIDAALPSIQEDDDHDSSFGKSTEEAAPEESSTFESHSTFDTVFKPHDHVQNFKESLTPTSSSAELPREKQRYSSLLGDSSTLDDASTRKPSTEIVDSESDATVAAVGSPVSEPSTVIRKKSSQKPSYNWNNIISKSQPIDRIALFKEALKKENEYDSGLREWLQEALKQVENSPNMHIGKIASQAYQNAPHNELRRHTSLRSKVSSVRDKVETSGLQASTLGKRFLNRDLFTFWLRSMYGFYHREDPLKDLLDEIKNVQTYSEWKNKVMKIDKLTNMDLWRQDLISKHYDYILVNERLKSLRAARFDQDSQLIMSLLRSGLVRNFGGIAQKRLFTKAYLGTKHNIEEYIEEVLECLNYLNESINTPSDRENVEYIMNSKQLKLDFFHDVRQSFGCTALVLQGGSLFGLCHLGVVKALYFKGLLPRIIGGSAVGAAVASLVCTLTDEELIPILISIQDAMGDVDRLNHDVDERYGNVIENVVKKGYSQDILVFLKFVRDTIGDLTFEEAYLKTEKVLNIVVHPSHSSVPSLLNYITSPNVIIWTAIYASIGTGVLSDNVQLYVKDFNNNIVPKEPNIPIKFMKPQDVSYSQQYFRGFKKNDHSDMERSDGSRQNSKVESPYTRLTELFNVNHFINSLARPYLAPLISNDLKHYHSYGKVRYNFKSLEVDTNNDDEADVTFGYLMDEPQQSKSFVIDKRKSFLADPESYTKDTSINLFKNLKNILGLELQHRLEVMNKLGILSDVIKRFCIDEKPAVAPSLAGIREVSIVPELRYLLRDFGRVFDVHKTMENIPYWVLVGERSVWPLFPLLWVRCSIEFTLDDLYNSHRKK